MLLRFRANAAKKKGEFGGFQQQNDAVLKNAVDKILKYLADESCLPAKLSALIREAIKEFKNEITKNLKDLYSALGNQVELERSLENKIEELFDKIAKKAVKNKNYQFFLEEMLDEAFTSDSISFIEKILSDPIDLRVFAKLFHEKHLNINNELYRAAQQGCVHYFDMLLKNKKADVNYVSPGTDLAILFACVEAVNKIIFEHYYVASLPDTNMGEQQLKDKLSPYSKIIEKLINLGADPLWVDKDGRSCLSRLESICKTRTGKPPRAAAIEFRDNFQVYVTRVKNTRQTALEKTLLKNIRSDHTYPLIDIVHMFFIPSVKPQSVVTTAVSADVAQSQLKKGS